MPAMVPPPRSFIRIRNKVFTKKINKNSCTPHCFMCQRPIYEIKLQATIKPYKAGTKSPNRFTEGENTAGKVSITIIKPMIQMVDMILGRFIF